MQIFCLPYYPQDSKLVSDRLCEYIMKLWNEIGNDDSANNIFE